MNTLNFLRCCCCYFETLKSHLKLNTIYKKDCWKLINKFSHFVVFKLHAQSLTTLFDFPSINIDFARKINSFLFFIYVYKCVKCVDSILFFVLLLLMLWICMFKILKMFHWTEIKRYDFVQFGFCSFITLIVLFVGLHIHIPTFFPSLLNKCLNVCNELFEANI